MEPQEVPLQEEVTTVTPPIVPTKIILTVALTAVTVAPLNVTAEISWDFVNKTALFT